MKLGLIFTNDWELYGDGSGEYFSIQHIPMEKLFASACNLGVRLTVMAEVGQQMAHLELAEEQDWARNVSTAWETILISMMEKGADVQLHLHPQWCGSTYANGNWQLDLSRWAISSLADDEIDRILREGKSYLEKLLKSANPDYECVVFRAGGYAIQPSSRVVNKLKKHGFLCDSSVVKGSVKKGLYDYRSAYSNFAPWYIKNDVAKRAREPGLLEIPVCSKTSWQSPLLRRILPPLKANAFQGYKDSDYSRNWLRENSDYREKNYPAKSKPLQQSRGISARLKGISRRLLLRKNVVLNYDRLSPEEFCYVLNEILKDARKFFASEGALVLPVIATGHVKEMKDTENFCRIIEQLKRCFNGTLLFWTMTDAVKYCLSNSTLLGFDDGKAKQ